jgi:hypothetical protein
MLITMHHEGWSIRELRRRFRMKRNTIRRIPRAHEHALPDQAFEGEAIERTLKAKAVPRTMESIRNEYARQELLKALPKVMQWPLDEYSEIVGQEKEDADKAGRVPDKDQEPSEDPEAPWDAEGP